MLNTTRNMLRQNMMAGVAAASIAITPAVSVAQTVRDQEVPNVGLNVPRNVTVFNDKTPSNVYKPTAVVNGEIITATDVNQRLALLVIANGGKIAPEEAQRLRVQIFSNLVDEKLQIQAAKAADIEVKNDDVDAQFARIAANFKQTPAAFTAYLAKNGSSANSMKQQIRGEMAWDRLLGRNVEPFTNVSKDEVNSILERMQAARGSDEFALSEIYISATPETMPAAAEKAKQIIGQLQQGGSFPGYARQYSEASTAVVGGDLGWIRPAVLPEEMAQAVATMQPGQISVVPIPGGITIMLLREKRKVLVANANDAVLSLKQIRLPFPAGTTQQKASELAGKFATQTRTIKGCGMAEDVAKQLGAEIVSRDQIALRDLPPQLQNTLLELQVGQTTQPFGSPDEGVSVLVLCGRDLPADVGLPSSEQVESQIRQDKVNKRAQRYLRDLRRDAIIDYS